MESKRMEITIGKLRTVITIWLLFAFEAIPERRVSEAAKPHDVKTIVKIKVQRISTGLKRNKTNNPKPVIARTRQRRKL